jgi:hypothetical protein
VHGRESAFLEARIASGQLLWVISERYESFWPQIQLGNTGQDHGPALLNLQDRHIVGHQAMASGVQRGGHGGFTPSRITQKKNGLVGHGYRAGV